MRKKAEAEVSLCELPAGASGTRKKRQPGACALYRHREGFRWQGIKEEPYKPKGTDWAHIVRCVLVGAHGETAKFHVRYFEISSGGNSSLEKHRHEHVVICIRGRGMVRTGKNKRSMGYLDTLYIAPDTPHQLMNPFKEPFGFLCIVNAKRDRPRLLKP
jgi:ribulose-bisphosphate carboxylase large chain